MQKSVGTNFSKLPVEDPETGDVLAVIETPRGSRNKYAFDCLFFGIQTLVFRRREA
jgi:hypothetical protein